MAGEELALSQASPSSVPDGIAQGPHPEDREDAKLGHAGPRGGRQGLAEGGVLTLKKDELRHTSQHGRHERDDREGNRPMCAKCSGKRQPAPDRKGYDEDEEVDRRDRVGCAALGDDPAADHGRLWKKLRRQQYRDQESLRQRYPLEDGKAVPALCCQRSSPQARIPTERQRLRPSASLSLPRRDRGVPSPAHGHSTKAVPTSSLSDDSLGSEGSDVKSDFMSATA